MAIKGMAGRLKKVVTISHQCGKVQYLQSRSLCKTSNIRYDQERRFFFGNIFWQFDCPLAKKFPGLFNCALVNEAKFKNCFERCTNRDEVIWCPIFKRNLKDMEERQFLSLLNLLRDVIIPEEGEDIRIWKASKDCSFSVLLFYLADSTRTVWR